MVYAWRVPFRLPFAVLTLAVPMAVRMSDVADIIDGSENTMQAAWMNHTPAVIVNIQRQPGANIIAVVDRIKAILPQLQVSLPASIKLQILTDRTELCPTVEPAGPRPPQNTIEVDVVACLLFEPGMAPMSHRLVERAQPIDSFRPVRHRRLQMLE